MELTKPKTTTPKKYSILTDPSPGKDIGDDPGNLFQLIQRNQLNTFSQCLDFYQNEENKEEEIMNDQGLLQLYGQIGDGGNGYNLSFKQLNDLEDGSSSEEDVNILLPSIQTNEGYKKFGLERKVEAEMSKVGQ